MLVGTGNFFTGMNSKRISMKSLILLTLCLSMNTFSAEVDQFSRRTEKIHDSLLEINAKANRHLEKALERVNLEQQCNPNTVHQTKLYTELKKEFANHSKGQFIIDLLHDKNLAVQNIPLKESIYGTWNITNGFLLGRKKAASSPLAIFPLINLNGYYIGLDKLEHMFGMGFIYFNRHHIKRQKLKRVLKHGILREKTVLGGLVLATGVFSYSDLSANFNGMRFWNHMLQNDNDVLGKDYNIGPYIKCESGKWVSNKEKPIDFSHYIDDSMDESLNCSKFANKKSVKKFSKKMKDIDPSYSCPMDMSKIIKMKRKYDLPISQFSSISNWIINTSGNSELSLLDEF